MSVVWERIPTARLGRAERGYWLTAVASSCATKFCCEEDEGSPAIGGAGEPNRCFRSLTTSSSIICCSSTLLSCSRRAMFSVLSAVTSPAKLSGSTSGDWPYATAAKPIMRPLRRHRIHTLSAWLFSSSTLAAQLRRPFLRQCRLVYGARSYSRVEGNCNTGCFSCIGVNPVI